MKSEQSKKRTKPLTKYQSEIFVKYYPLVRKVVNSMKGRLPAYADIDELHSAGVAGLADAVKRIDAGRKETYESYISTRIRGSIIDELRSLDYMSRSARQDAKNIERARADLEQTLRRAPSDGELRRALGVTPKQYEKMLRRTQVLSFISLNNSSCESDLSAPRFEESVPDKAAPTPLGKLVSNEISSDIRSSINSLPDKQRRVIDSYYFQDKKLGDIAKEFGLTEARICQIHSQALKNLRPKLAN